MQVIQTIPILHIFDVTKARQFYLDYLGFQVDWEHRFEPALPLYLRFRAAAARCIAKPMEVTDPFGNRLRFNEDLK